MRFDGWSDHYVLNVAVAAMEWMRTNDHMKGTCTYEQMLDINKQALEEYKRRDGDMRSYS